MRKAMFLVLMLIGLMATTSAFAQEVTGSIVGTVKDQSGAVIPNAKVTITNTDTNVAIRTLTANQDGEFTAPLLPLGNYSISAEAPGFKKATISKITLHLNEKLTFTPTLQVGSSGDTVTVEAEALQVELQSAEASGLINGTQVRELALNGRNWVQLMTLIPGVSDSGNSDQIYVGAFGPQGINFTVFTVNGGRREQNNYMVDGVDNVDRGSNLTLLAFPNVDAISEFKVARSQYDPEQGRAGGGQINVVTRSGTSKLHGGLFEFWRNDALNANGYFTKRTQLLNNQPNKPNKLRYHNFGGTIGGPVWIPKIYEQTNKTFFFFSEEFRRNIIFNQASAIVPTDPMILGQFRVPVCVAYNASNQCTAVGTSIAPAAFDNVAKAYITDVFSKYPRPNAATAASPFTFSGPLRTKLNFREEIYKIDHHFGQKLRVSGKLLRDHIPTEEPQAIFGGNGPLINGIGTTSTNSPGHNYTFRGTLTLNPTVLIEGGYGYSYGAILSDPIGLMTKTASPTVAAAAQLPFASSMGRIPNATFAGGQGALNGVASGASGPATFGPYRNFNRNHTFFGNLSKMWGGHSLKFGATFYRYRKNENAANGNQGTYAYNANGIPGTTASTSSPITCTGGAAGTAGSTCPFSFEQSWANFLLGRVGIFTQSSLDLTADIRANQFEYYAQDSWRVRPNLTVNYGFRHSFFRQPTDALGLLSNFDPSTWDPAKSPCITATGALDVTKNPTTSVLTSACNPNYDPLNGYIYANPPAGFESHKSPYGSKVGKEYNLAIAPRLGIAWDPYGDGKTAIRAGFGLFYDSGLIFGNAEINIFNGLGFNNPLSFTNVTTASPTGGAAVPSNGLSTSVTQAQSRIDPNYHSPYSEQWSLNFQRDLGLGYMLDVGYYGNSGVRLPGFYDLNQPAENAYRACTIATPCKGGPNGANVINFGAVPVVTTANTARLNGIRPFTGYAGAPSVRGMYSSRYHGLQSQFQKKFSGKTMFSIAYTWSHALTNYIADRSTGNIMPIQGHIRDNNWGPGIGDRRHVWTSNFVWELPWLIKQQGFVGHVFGGWQLSGIQTFQTGLPATVSSNQSIDPTGAGCLSPSPCAFRANQVGDPDAGAPRSFTAWFNPAAFTSPVAGQTTIPSSRPGSVRLPGFWRIDMGLFKNLKFTEQFGGQFRLETFNTLNHTNPICCASLTQNSSIFNTITAARDPRTMQLALKLTF